MKRWFRLTTILCLLTVMSFGAVYADSSEVEPNDSPSTATTINRYAAASGEITPAADIDYFVIDGINTSWGFIALLDTRDAAAMSDAKITALGTDGVTELQSNSGTWAYGSGIAFQNYADGSGDHYLKVEGTSSGITDLNYTLKYYPTVISTQAEVEPNEDRLTGTPSSYTMTGSLSSSSDVDCYQFQGHSGDDLVSALKYSSLTQNYDLKILGPTNSILAEASSTEYGGSEFIEYDDLPEDGVYAYCVYYTSSSGPVVSTTYQVGLVNKNGLYRPDFKDSTSLANLPGYAYYFPGQEISVEISSTNESPVEIPGQMSFSINFDPLCVSYQSADLVPTTTNDQYVSWGNAKDGLAPGETFAITANFTALAECSSQFDGSITHDYYFMGTGSNVSYVAKEGELYLPQILH